MTAPRGAAPRHTALGNPTACVCVPPPTPPTKAVAPVPPLIVPRTPTCGITKGRDIEVTPISEPTACRAAPRSAAAGARTRRMVLRFTGSAAPAADGAGASSGNGIGDIVSRTWRADVDG